ncbi:tRNA (adenosine(37)-N6)-dimethylallyltransferase MiaA [Nitrosomonas sp. PY1]|uniref:tRNA (adenosine(37)-N6)-dimethylallyltransferase MiaA n=1 Tax=Nitrosomonas sp. PY1 TaxID=1803906 RepID=UPI001FC7ED91|nr:tRNA (adenosine(37)-N6)-dimethylallyltransferase MiaA [Nitrosomonas sp. PY1]
MHLSPAIFLMGPTASGKSQIALEITTHFPVEIINVDSAQIYRYMDIGTAKPSSLILQQIPHHLTDIIDPVQHYSVAQFRQNALALMQDITARHKIPLLVGGTMLYFKALLEGLSELPSADKNLRSMLEKEASVVGWPAMHQKLLQLDLETAKRIQPTDSQRIQRALEICLLTDKPLSEIIQASQPSVDFPYHPIQIALIPDNRSELHHRIAKRFQNMLSSGLVEEVSLLRKRFPELDTQHPSMRCVGYRQTWLFLNNQISRNELHDKGIAATRQLAKRQLTWLRSLNKQYPIQTFDCLSSQLSQQVIHFLTTQIDRIQLR